MQPFVFTNESSVATVLGEAGVAGENRDQFRLARDGCTEATLAPGASCEVGVRFAPDEGGAMSATLRLGSTGGVATAALSGYAGPVVSAARSSASPRASLHLSGRPLHLTGPMLRVGTISCPSEEACRVVTRATIVAPNPSIRTGGTRRLGPWTGTLAIPAGGDRALVLRLPPAGTRGGSGRARCRCPGSRASGARGGGAAEVRLR